MKARVLDPKKKQDKQSQIRMYDRLRVKSGRCRKTSRVKGQRQISLNKSFFVIKINSLLADFMVKKAYWLLSFRSGSGKWLDMTREV